VRDMRVWSFGRKVGAAFGVMVLLVVVISGVGVSSLRSVVAAKDSVIEVNCRNLTEVERLRAALDRKIAAGRAFMLTKEDRFLDRAQSAREDCLAAVHELKLHLVTEEGQRLIERIERAEVAHQNALDRVVALRRADAPLDVVGRAFDSELVPERDAIDQDATALVALEQHLLEDHKRGATDAAASAIGTLLGGAAVAGVLALLVALTLTRALSSQIGAAVQHVQSSSAELQSAASQQATGAREQASAMAEITTTISELLATSRQIAESAKRVARIAEETAGGARAGDQTVQRANDALGSTRRQVDVVVTHMLELGRKSQLIGGVLDVINELAEQTNILSINASIEAAGAGDAGKRFGVVADEIRKLADRVAGSTKEIRALVDEVRGAVNATVMATEGGSKAVDGGVRHFSDVAASFKEIASLVTTTTEAAREIELSTKQQATAVEQVNLAVANVAQATRETEASSAQTLQTASELNGLSRELAKIVQPNAQAS